MKGPTVNCCPSGPPQRSRGRAGIRGYASPCPAPGLPAPGRPARRARLSLSSPRRGGWCWPSSTWPRRPRCCCSACKGPWAATSWTSPRPPAWRWWSAWASWSPRPPASSLRCLRCALLWAPSARSPLATGEREAPQDPGAPSAGGPTHQDATGLRFKDGAHWRRHPRYLEKGTRPPIAVPVGARAAEAPRLVFLGFGRAERSPPCVLSR